MDGLQTAVLIGVLLLFLPALRYWESLTTSPREIRRNLRAILLLAVPLVLVTVAAVALLGVGFGLPLTVASVVGRLPRRTSTVLRAESLINDGTALTVYAVAVAAVSSGVEVDMGAGAVPFLAAYGGGVAIGLVIAMLAVGARRVVQGSPVLENTVGVLTPLAAYLPAEELHVSGVLAAVTAGLVITRFASRLVSARTRAQALGFWQVATWILNGALFLLIGFQTHTALEGLGADPLHVLGLALGRAGAVIGARLVWLAIVPYLIGAVDRRPSQRALQVPVRQRSVIAWAGFRGAVSLAAALALPEDFPMRDDLITVTLVVTLITLRLQGLTLPAVVQWARLPEDPIEADEERRAEEAALLAGLTAIPSVADRLGVPDDVRDRVLADYRSRAEQKRTDETKDQGGSSAIQGSESALRRATIAAKREAVIRLRDTGEIDDTVLRRVQHRLDIEELRLSDAEVEPR